MSYEPRIIVCSESVEMKMPAGEPTAGPAAVSASASEEAFREENVAAAAPEISSATREQGNSTTNSTVQKDLQEPLCPSPPETNKSDYGAIHTSAPRMYSPDATLDVSKDVASGYLVLLTGGTISADGVDKRGLRRNGKKAKAKKCCNRLRSTTSAGQSSSQNSTSGETTNSTNTRIPDEAIQLAFMSLTDGNVIDTVFGVHSRGGIKRAKDTSKFAFEAAREAKEALREASYSSEAIPRIAVEAYELCFEIIIDYQKRLEKIGLFSQCYQRDIIRGEAEDSLEEAFTILREAIEAAT